MATVRLNDEGIRQAKGLIKSGSLERRETWTFSGEESAAILGDPPDWKKYGSWHLGIRTGTSRKTKQAYAYPFGKGGKLFRSALMAARQRAAQQGHNAVFNATGQLMQLIDGKEVSLQSVRDNMNAIGAFAAEAMPVAWESLPEIVIQLLPYTGGELATAVDGREIRVTDRSIQSIADKFNGRQNPLVLDYEHGTYNPMLEMGSLAAGWIQEVWPVASDANVSEIVDDRVREAADLYGPGIYAVVHLTERAAEMVRSREYQFVSPVVVQNESNEVLELLGAGLTNDPALDGMMPIAAKRSGSATVDSARGNADPSAAEAAPTDSVPDTQGEDEMDLDKFTTLLGRKVESESDLAEAIGMLKAQADTAELNATKIAELEAERLDREATEAVTLAVEEGRLAPSQKDWAKALFMSDRKAWDSYLSATEKGTFSAERKVPPQGRMTGDKEGATDAVEWTEDVKFFGTDIPVNKDELAKLNEAIQLSRDKFNGDLARAIRTVRR